MPTSTMKWVVVDNVLLACVSEGTVPKEVWDSYIADLKKESHVTCLFSATISSVDISSVQRKQFTDVLKLRGLPVAALTDSTFVRGLVTAVSWVGANISAHPWNDMQSALQFLKLNELTQERCTIAMTQLREACLAKQPSGLFKPLHGASVDKKPGGALKPPL